MGNIADLILLLSIKDKWHLKILYCGIVSLSQVKYVNKIIKKQRLEKIKLHTSKSLILYVKEYSINLR